jgi:Uma2 family endonuclease
MLHQIVVNRLTVALSQYLRIQPVGLAFGVPGDLTWGRADVLVQPDVFVTRLDEARMLDWEAIRTLLLVVEVLSPSSLKQDRFTKRRRYQEAGVSLYWIVDPDAREVEEWTSNDSFPRVERERLRWQPEGASAPFTLELADLFQPV